MGTAHTSVLDLEGECGDGQARPTATVLVSQTDLSTGPPPLTVETTSQLMLADRSSFSIWLASQSAEMLAAHIQATKRCASAWLAGASRMPACPKKTLACLHHWLPLVRVPLDSALSPD